MEIRTIDKDIPILYVTATSFPDGIPEAYEKLHVHVPFSPNRKFYGLSRPEKANGIVYKAAAEAKAPDEAGKFGLDTMVIPKGTYISETVHNFREDMQLIGKTFEKLLKQPNLDRQGYCIEWYLPDDKDVICMIRLAQ